LINEQLIGIVQQETMLA